MTYESFLRFQSGQPFLGVFDFRAARIGIFPKSEDSAKVMDIFFLRKELAFPLRIPDGNLIGFPNRGFCVKSQELRHLLQEKMASFIGQQGIGISFSARPRLRIRSRLEIPSCPRRPA